MQTPKVAQQPTKRRRVNPFADIVTSDESFQNIEDELKKGERREREKGEKRSKSQSEKRKGESITSKEFKQG